jgi:preprotein translocase subunit SecF
MAKDITKTDNQNPAVEKPERVVPFLKIVPVTLAISLALIVVGIVFYVKHGGFTLGIDFKAARASNAVLTPDVSINNIRVLFDNIPGDKQVTTLGAVSDQHFLITLSAEDTNQVIQGVETITATLNAAYGESNVTILGSELVGPKIGGEFAKRSILLLLVVAGLILLYVAIRFDFYYGTGAVMALFHDMLILSAFCVILQHTLST